MEQIHNRCDFFLSLSTPHTSLSFCILIKVCCFAARAPATVNMKRTKHIWHFASLPLPLFSPTQPPLSQFCRIYTLLCVCCWKKWNNSSARFYLVYSRHAIKINYIAYTRVARSNIYIWRKCTNTLKRGSCFCHGALSLEPPPFSAPTPFILLNAPSIWSTRRN